MARVEAKKFVNAFVKGLVTDAGPLTYPEDAALGLDNVILNTDGSLQRRRGMDYDPGYNLSAELAANLFADGAVGVHEWRAAGGLTGNAFLVLQIGSKLYIHSISSTAPGAVHTIIDLTDHATAYASNVGYTLVQTAVGKGVMFVSAKEIDPFYILYNATSDTFTTHTINIQIRDFAVLDTSFSTKYHPTPIEIIAEGNDNFPYNIRNAGWGDDLGEEAIDLYLNRGIRVKWGSWTETFTWPSMNQVWEVGKNTSDDFSATQLDKQHFGQAPAPRGFYILDAFNKDRANIDPDTIVDWYSSIGTEAYKWRPETTAFFAGRAWFAGQDSELVSNVGNPTTNPSIHGNIYFSQLLEDMDKVGKCYQELDPTSFEASDVLDTDGGVITIPEVGKVLKLVPLGRYLLVLASNGVWAITGEQGFKATDYAVDFIGRIEVSGAESIVVVEDAVTLWATAGIYVIVLDPQLGTPKASSISKTVIQSFYETISSIARLNCTGTYDTLSHKVHWLYNDTTAYNGSSDRNKYNRELVFDTVLGAFYTNTLGELDTYSPYVVGALTTPNVLTTERTFDIEVSGTTVQANAVDVQVTQAVPSAGDASIKYVFAVPQVAGTIKYTFGKYREATFYDWITADGVGVDSPAYITTGYDILGDAGIDKQVINIMVFSKRTETQFVDDGSGNAVFDFPSSIKLQARWEWTDSAAAGRWTGKQEVYKLPQLYTPSGTLPEDIDFGFTVVTTKNQIRGHGRALSLNFTSSPGNDMRILGWGIPFAGASVA